MAEIKPEYGFFKSTTIISRNFPTCFAHMFNSKTNKSTLYVQKRYIKNLNRFNDRWISHTILLENA